MMHPHTEVRLVNPAIGRGVFATQFLLRGTIVWVIDGLDRVFSLAKAHALPRAYGPLLDRYCYRDAQDRLILCWDHARLMNHSCEPNCLGADLGFELAVRDIHPGEELTDDYTSLHLRPHEAFDCLCGASECRRTICREDRDVLEQRWNLLLSQALAAADSVAQPLAELLRPAQLVRARRTLFARLG